ncbi:MAG: UbiA family prenyltransferase [Planctomycetota bacterium]
MTNRRRRAGLAIPSDLAIYAASYLAGCVWLFGVATGADTPPGATAAAFLMGLGLYLLDRVKLQESWLDAADLYAQPARHAFLRRHSGIVRVSAVTSLVVALILIAAMSVRLVALVPLAILGVLAYARSGSARIRLKDMTLVKALFVGMGLATIAWCAHLPVDPGTRLPADAWAFLLITLQGTADGALCDIDDRVADSRFGTRSLPAVLGIGWTWAIAAACQAGVLGIALAIDQAGLTTVCAMLALTTPLLAALPDGQRRDAIDVRLPLICALVAIL